MLLTAAPRRITLDREIRKVFSCPLRNHLLQKEKDTHNLQLPQIQIHVHDSDTNSIPSTVSYIQSEIAVKTEEQPDMVVDTEYQLQ